MNNKDTIFLTIVTAFIVTGIIGYSLQNTEATGCPVTFVNEHIDNALKAFDEKNAEELKNQLDLAKQAINAAAEEAE